jgi:hypothetical protein
MSRHSEKIAIFQIAIFSGDFWWSRALVNKIY